MNSLIIKFACSFLLLPSAVQAAPPKPTFCHLDINTGDIILTVYPKSQSIFIDLGNKGNGKNSPHIFLSRTRGLRNLPSSFHYFIPIHLNANLNGPSEILNIGPNSKPIILYRIDTRLKQNAYIFMTSARRNSHAITSEVLSYF